MTRAERIAILTARYAEGLAAIDRGVGPEWGPDLAAAIRRGERPYTFVKRTGYGRSCVYAALNDPYKVAERKRKGTYVCPSCGKTIPHTGEVVRPKRCRYCDIEHRHEVARRRYIDALCDWHRRYGDWPSAGDWNPAPSQLAKLSDERAALVRQRQSEGNWPPTSGAAQVFGSWFAAIEAASEETGWPI